MSKQDAANSIRQLAVMFQGMTAAAEALDTIGSIEQATKEAQAATAKAGADRDAALLELDKAKDDITAARQTAEKVMVEAEREANDLIAKANLRAAQIEQAADDAAKVKMEEANKEADASISASRDVLARLQNKIALAEVAALNAQQAQSDAEAKAAAATETLDAIKAQIAKLAAQ